MLNIFQSRISKIISVAAAILFAGSAVYFWQVGGVKNGEHASAGDAISENIKIAASDQIYTNPDYQFSILFSEGFRAHAFKDENSGGDIILLEQDFRQNGIVTSLEEKPGLQIFITPFDEEGPITVERILEDVPDMIIDDAKDAIIGGNKIHALIFFSKEESLEKTREVWFVHNAHLYQISALAKFDTWLAGVLAHLVFSDSQ